MVRRVTPSQIRSMLRQAESKQRQAVNNHNRQVRDHNAKVKRAADAYNRDIREYNAKRRRAIEAVNRDIRTYNSRVRTYRARLQEVRSVLVRQQPVVGHFYSIHQSAIELSAAYDLLDRSHADPYLADLGEKEAVNSLTVVKDLIEGTEGDVYSGDAITDSKITTELSGISQELSVRWHGALYALNPRNPEAARHFCSSSREIVAGSSTSSRQMQKSSIMIRIVRLQNGAIPLGGQESDSPWNASTKPMTTLRTSLMSMFGT